jgi:hypothetical protein
VGFASSTESRSTRSWKATRTHEMLLVSDPSEPANTWGVSVSEQHDSGSLCHGSNPCEAGYWQGILGFELFAPLVWSSENRESSVREAKKK